MELKVYDQIDELILENKRLKKLVDDLQREYMNRINDLAEIHPMEEK
jgi:hypothetical protein